MAQFTLKSKRYGRVFFFGRERTSDQHDGYLRVSINGGEYRQPCHGGGFLGSTVMTGEDIEVTARKWWRQHLDLWREWGHPDA